MRVVSYWVFPIISGLVWLATLLGLLLWWIVTTHRAILPSMDPDLGQQVAYISDCGATTLKPLFIVGCVLTTVFLDASFLCDRWLRYKGRLVPNESRGERILSGSAIFFALVGTIGLCFLSGFDTLRYPILHDIFLLLFIAGYLLSAVFVCWEYQRLGIKHREHSILRISFWIKLIFVLVELFLAIAFAALNFLGQYNHAGIIEWTIAFIFSFYVFSFFLDLWPATRTKGGGHDFGKRGADASALQMEENRMSRGR